MRAFNKDLCGIVLMISALGLAACSSPFASKKEEPRLPGERISIMELQRSLEPDAQELNAEALSVPSAWRNEFWPQAGGYPNHAMQNLALNTGPLKKLWSQKIGRGSSDEIPLTVQPVVAGNRIFTLDTKASLRAFNTSDGKQIWKSDVGNDAEDDYVIAGGIGFGENLLYVTNGYNELLSVRPSNGEIIWRKTMPSASRAAPTILNGRIFVSTLDSRVLAYDSATGDFLWEYQGINESAGLIGAAAPAVSSDLVVGVFSSGDVAAIRPTNGSGAWSDNLSNSRRLGGDAGVTGLSDIRGLPVMDNGLVIVVSFSGKLVAIDAVSGIRVWQREIGGAETPWVADNVIYVLSSENDLVALGRDTGVIYWVAKLPKNKRGDNVTFTGPVLAGGRLILAGTDGIVIEVAPESGELLNKWDINKDIFIAPIVAQETLYLLRSDGTLYAYQ